MRITVALAALLMSSAAAFADDMQDCRSNDPVRAIGACSLVLQTKTESKPTQVTATTAAAPGTCTGLQFDDGNVVRTSVGVGIIWASPFGPLRFDYAVPLTKGQFDRVQQFKFGGGTSF